MTGDEIYTRADSAVDGLIFRITPKKYLDKLLERITSSSLGRYGLSLGIFAILLGISALLSYLDAKFSLTILILAGLVITGWYAGLGPGILMAVLIVTTTLLTQPRPADASLAKVLFGAFSNLLLIVFIIWLIHSRKVAEIKLTDKGLQLQRLNETLEGRVIERTNELEAANRDLESFSYSVSHDLRAPLRAIDGFSAALREDYGHTLDDEGKFYLDNVRESASRMNLLIDDMMELSRLTRAELKRSDVNLSEIARQILSELQRKNPDRKVECEVQDDLIAFADKRLVHIALQNLLENAWKFTSKCAAAKIEFGMVASLDRPEYFVRDNGAGFDMRYADKLFAAFERLHSANEFDGTGIGLATVQRVMQKHGGSVRGESEVGKGSQFYFTL